MGVKNVSVREEKERERKGMMDEENRRERKRRGNWSLFGGNFKNEMRMTQTKKLR